MEVAGFTQEPKVQWIGPRDGYLDQSSYVDIPPPVHVGNLTVVSSVIIPILNVSLAGLYTCIAMQPTRTMVPVHHSAEEVLPVMSKSQQLYNSVVISDKAVHITLTQRTGAPVTFEILSLTLFLFPFISLSLLFSLSLFLSLSLSLSLPLSPLSLTLSSLSLSPSL